MNRVVYEELQTRKVLSFFRAFIRKLVLGKFQVMHWGWWHIGNGKYGLSLYWKEKE